MAQATNYIHLALRQLGNIVPSKQCSLALAGVHCCGANQGGSLETKG